MKSAKSTIQHGWQSMVLAAVFLLIIFPCLDPGLLAAEEAQGIGSVLPWWSVLPFAGILLSIALIPMVNGEWWEHNMAKVSAFWALAFIIPFGIGFSGKLAVYEVLHILVADYIPFIILLAALFTISGGIIVRGTLKGSPVVNTVILLIGTFFASFIGTTGSAMLLIRPIIRANQHRKHKMHTIVFFIFLVCNIGGSLTPLGDPPLFLGFLHGVPFFWTLTNFLPMLFNVALLTVVYFALDSYFYKKENLKAGDDEAYEPLRVDGLRNLIFLGGVLLAVIGSGVFSGHPAFAVVDSVTGAKTMKGIAIMTVAGESTLVWPWLNLLRDGILILMAVLSMKFTAKNIRDDNFFTWGPIQEVGVLFAGIFMTIIPAMAILQAKGAGLGVTSPAQFFWATGALSSFLDNAPTYLTFASLAGGLHAASGVVTDLGTIAPDILKAISCGAVFMGANTYIGNAPNFMVLSIAQENKVKMPSFFGYMGWALVFLIPLFILNTLIFFR